MAYASRPRANQVGCLGKSLHVLFNTDDLTLVIDRVSPASKRVFSPFKLMIHTIKIVRLRDRTPEPRVGTSHMAALSTEIGCEHSSG